jgi:hypothetical protein
MISPEHINLVHITAEVRSVFESYEAALMRNDLETLDRLFWRSPLAVRFGTCENLYGIEAIRAFRHAREGGALKRTLCNTTVTTYGTDLATATTEFVRADQALGRQSQTWVRFPDGWRIVTAHISLIEAAPGGVS